MLPDVTTLACMSIELVGLDADDTLWHNEGHFNEMEARFCELMEPWLGAGEVSAALLEKERENIDLLGYGAKAFTLSIIETAVEISAGEIDGATIGRIVELGYLNRRNCVGEDGARWGC